MNSLISRLIYPGASRSVDVGQVERSLEPGEELVWQETARDERIGLIIRPPAAKQRWIIFFYGNGMTVAGTWAVRQWLMIVAGRADDPRQWVQAACQCAARLNPGALRSPPYQA